MKKSHRLECLKKSLKRGDSPGARLWLAVSVVVMTLSAASFALAPVFLGRWVEALRAGAGVTALGWAFGSYLFLYALGFCLRDAQWATYSRFEREFFKTLTAKIYRENLLSDAPRTETELSMGLQGAQGFLFSALFLVLPYGLEALAAICSVLGTVSLPIGMFFSVFCVGYVLLLQWSTKRISRKNRDFVRSLQNAFGLMQSFLGNRALIRRSGAIPFSEGLTMARVHAQEDLRVAVAGQRTHTSLVVNLWVMVSLGGSLLLGIYGYRHGHISFGALVATESFFFQIMRRLEIWARGFRESSMYADQLEPVLSAPPPRADRFACVSWRESLAYGSGLTVIHGATGSGKSTLLKAWADDPSNNGAYVSQFPEILPLSIQHNLCLGRNVDEAKIKETLARLRLTDVIARLPQGMSTILASDGQPLSGGELQRLCLARAVLSGRDLIFLDEPTSHQPESQELPLIQELMSLLQDKTVVCVSHRRSFQDIAKRTLRCDAFGKLSS